MKVMTILGTRPEIIRLTCVIEKLDTFCEHVLVHTGQNYDENLSDIFFRDLNVRKPDRFLGVQGKSTGEQIGKIISLTDEIIREENPDRLLILGDTNSSLSVIPAKRLGVPVFHMEAGNRCYDDRVPEEVNRRIIDHSSDILLPYTERSRKNLLREGFDSFRIFVTGNPIFEVIQKYSSKIEQSTILQTLQIQPQKYFLVTMHRAENVDIPDRLRSILQGLDMIQKKYNIPIIVSVHPHTRNRFEKYSIDLKNESIILCEPFGFIDFISLEKNAGCVISDSGTVQEECCIFGVPNVTIRDVTERPETIECGSNILSGSEPRMIQNCVDIVKRLNSSWIPPDEYGIGGVSDTVIKIVLGYHNNIKAKN